MDANTLFSLGIALILVGVFIAIAAFLLLLLSNIKGKVKGGGAIIIGPVPIIFGTNKESLKTVLLFAVALTILLLIMLIVFYFVFR
jgi:uncharacterized protein (TIGR00304 family)